jgi:hypothetical protein
MILKYKDLMIGNPIWQRYKLIAAIICETIIEGIFLHQLNIRIIKHDVNS